MTAPRLSATGFHHEAFFYAGDEEFLAEAVPYLEEGVAAGETVLVVLPEPRLRMVRESMGAAAEAMEFWSMAVVGRNPGRLIAAWRDFLGYLRSRAGSAAASANRSRRAGARRSRKSASCTSGCSTLPSGRRKP